ncbi:MAG: response regulator [Geminicoccaceae bacterium]
MTLFEIASVFDRTNPEGPVTGASGRAGRPTVATELRNVLCVDDDADIRAITELALTMFGRLSVTLCDSGENCLSILQRESPDLVVLDVNMPGLDGVETLARIRSEPRTAAMPVVMLTARIWPSDVEAYHAAGATAVLCKPFDPTDLASRLQDIFDGHCRARLHGTE